RNATTRGYALGRETKDACALQDALPETINQRTGRGDTVVPLEFRSNETPGSRKHQSLACIPSRTVSWFLECSFEARSSAFSVYRIPCGVRKPLLTTPTYTRVAIRRDDHDGGHDRQSRMRASASEAPGPAERGPTLDAACDDCSGPQAL